MGNHCFCITPKRANVSTDSMQYETVSSIPISGYHRTQSEQEHKAFYNFFMRIHYQLPHREMAE